MPIDDMITPDQWKEAWKEGSERIERHLRRFDDIENFLSVADLAVQMYFWKQDKFSDITEFKAYLALLLREYRACLALSDYKALREKEARMAEIEETYDELVYFWEYNPEKSRKERIETWMTIEEQRAKPKGLVLRFKDAVKKVLE